MKQQLVELPEKRISYKKGPNGTKYVYYTLRSYRNKKGQPTSDEKSIGKLDPETGMLIPNKNYFDIFPEAAENTPKDTVKVGYIQSFLKLAETIGLSSILDNVFQDQSTDILYLAAYMVAYGNIMVDYEDWHRETWSESTQTLTSQSISRFFTTLSEDKRMDFFDQWSQQLNVKESIVYDVTSISTYSEQISLAEFGYNRDKEYLPQVNLGMFYSRNHHVPLFYSLYAGSLVDKVYLPYMMGLSQRLELHNLLFVADQGFVTQDNVHYLRGEHHHLLSLLPKNLKLYKRIINHQAHQTHSAKHWLSSLSVYGYSFHEDYNGVPIRIFLYFDPERASLQELQLYHDIERHEKTLKQLQGSKLIKPSHKKYFSIEETSPTEFTFTIDYDKIDEVKKGHGYFALFSTDEQMSAEEALKVYRQKDVIEKSFDQLKNGMEYRRLRTHSIETTEGKMFVAFIGLIIRTVMKQRLKENQTTLSLSLKKVIRELEKIQRIRLNNGEEQVIPLTKLQKEILAALEIKKYNPE